jgi:ankyrin repeat protein
MKLHHLVYESRFTSTDKLSEYLDSLSEQEQIYVISSLDNRGYTPVHIACYYGAIDALKIFLKLNIPKKFLETKTKDHYTCVQLAEYKGHTKVVELLLEYNNISPITIVETNELITTVKDGLDSQLQPLLETSDVNTQDLHQNTALHYAAEKGDPETVELLLSAGADTTILNSESETPLITAVKRYCGLIYGQSRETTLDTISALLENSDIDSYDSDGNTSLILAAAGSKYELTKFLLKTGSNPDLQNNKGETAISFACKNGDFDLIRILTIYKADYEIPDNAGNLPQDLAKQSGRYNQIRELFSDPIVENPRIAHESAESAESAESLGSVTEAPIIKADYIDTYTELMNAITSFKFHTVDRILSKNPDLDLNWYVPNMFDSCNSLCWAVSLWNSGLINSEQKNLTDIVKLLLKYGVNTNIKDTESNTAIMIAASYGAKSIVKILLEHDPNLENLNKYHENILHLACYPDTEGNADCLKLILKKVKPELINMENNDGHTPLCFASSHPKSEQVVTLLKAGADIHGYEIYFALEVGNINIISILQKAEPNVLTLAGIPESLTEEYIESLPDESIAWAADQLN